MWTADAESVARPGGVNTHAGVVTLTVASIAWIKESVHSRNCHPALSLQCIDWLFSEWNGRDCMQGAHRAAWMHELFDVNDAMFVCCGRKATQVPQATTDFIHMMAAELHCIWSQSAHYGGRSVSVQ